MNTQTILIASLLLIGLGGAIIAYCIGYYRGQNYELDRHEKRIGEIMMGEAE